MPRKKAVYEYSGLVYAKRKQYVKNKLHYGKGIPISRIKKITFNKRKSKGGWKFKAIVVK